MEAVRTGGVVIACGMAKYEGDAAVAQVFERADQRMYENKSELKNRQAAQKQ
jgi:GGDEF domain-containing protein